MVLERYGKDHRVCRFGAITNKTSLDTMIITRSTRQIAKEKSSAISANATGIAGSKSNGDGEFTNYSGDY